MQMPGQNSILLLKRTGPVSYSDNRYLKNLKGLIFERDTDWAYYSPKFAGMGFGIDFLEAYADGTPGFSAEIRIGEESCVAYLKQTSDWNAGGGLRLGLNKRWEQALGAIELVIDNQINPVYSAAPQ